MSHTVTIKIQVRDLTALQAACRRLSLDAPVEGKHELFEGEVQGHAVRLKDWSYPVVFDLKTGKGYYDNYNGRWGKQDHVDKLMQTYAVELAKAQLRRKGYSPVEQVRADGSIIVTATAA